MLPSSFDPTEAERRLAARRKTVAKPRPRPPVKVRNKRLEVRPDGTYGAAAARSDDDGAPGERPAPLPRAAKPTSPSLEQLTTASAKAVSERPKVAELLNESLAVRQDDDAALAQELGLDNLEKAPPSSRKTPTASEAEERAPGRLRTMGLAAALLVVAAVAVFVVVGDDLFGEEEVVTRRPRKTPAAAASVSESAATSPPPKAAALPSRPEPTAQPDTSAAPESTAEPAGSVAPTGELPPLPANLPSDGAELLTYRAYLVVRSSASVGVYVQGKHVGSTNELLEVHCRTRFIRLGEVPGPRRWLGPGLGMRIPCQKLSVIEMEPESN